MRKLLLISSLLAILCAPAVFAHDGAFGTGEAPLEVISWDGVDYVHDETAGQEPTPEYKGWATMIFVNNMEVPWTDFHFSISADLGGVFFENDGSVTHSMQDFPGFVDHGGYNVTFDDFQDIGTFGSKPTTVNFYFNAHPVLPGEIVAFNIYTDNTTNTNSFFTICATPTPEPMTVALLGLGGICLVRIKRK